MLKKEKIDYCILRNFEQFPNFSHDIDLYVNEKHLNSARRLLCDAFNKRKFYIGEISAFDNSLQSLHNIKIFRIYNYDTKEMLQIDFFTGFSIFAQPIIVFQLSEKIYCDKICNYVLNSSEAALINLFQLSKRLGDPKKFNAYHENVQRNRLSVLDKLERVGVKKKNIDKLNSCLDQNKVEDCIVSCVNAVKKDILLASFLRNPMVSFFNLVSRAISTFARYIIRPYGAIIFTVNSLEIDFLDKMKKDNIIPGYGKIVDADLSFFKKMERGYVFYFLRVKSKTKVQTKIISKVCGRNVH